MVDIKVINKIGEKIEAYQEKTGATKTWIAKQARISKQTLNTIIRSENPTIESMIKIARVIDCDIKELFELEVVEDDYVPEYEDGSQIEDD